MLLYGSTLISHQMTTIGVWIQKGMKSCTNTVPTGIIFSSRIIHCEFLDASCCIRTMQKITHLLFLDRFKDLDNAFLIVGNIYTLKHFTVFSPSNFPNNLIVILFTEYKQHEMKILGNAHLKNETLILKIRH